MAYVDTLWYQARTSVRLPRKAPEASQRREGAWAERVPAQLSTCWRSVKDLLSLVTQNSLSRAPYCAYRSENQWIYTLKDALPGDNGKT